jgi:hypothetical protein
VKFRAVIWRHPFSLSFSHSAFNHSRSERPCHTTPGSLFEEFAKPGKSFKMLRQEVDGDTAYIVWKANFPAMCIRLFQLP